MTLTPGSGMGNGAKLLVAYDAINGPWPFGRKGARHTARSNLRRWDGFPNVEPPGRKAGESQVQSSHPTTGLDCGGAKLSATYIEGMGWDGISLPTQTLR